jgi:hypothetical protein
LARSGVDDRGEHAHVIALAAIHALAGAFESAEDVSATHDEADFYARLAYGRDLLGGRAQGVHVKSALTGLGKGLTADF